MSLEDDKKENAAEPSLLEQRVVEYVKAVNEGREIEGSLMEMLAMAGAQAMADPTPDLIWKTLARDCEENGNWAGAEEAYKKVLELAKEHPNPAFPLKPHLDLASLYKMLGKKDEARAHIEIALGLARKSEIQSLLLMALESKSTCDLGERELEEISAAAKEGFETTPNERIYHLVKARFLLLQARCAAEFAKYDAAESLMAAARGFVGERDQSDFMTGYQWYHSRAAEVVAKIHAARGETAQAIDAYSETVARERTINSQPHVQGIRSRYRLALTLQTFANYLETGEKIAYAMQTRVEAEEILKSLKLPSLA